MVVWVEKNVPLKCSEVFVICAMSTPCWALVLGFENLGSLRQPQHINLPYDVISQSGQRE
jgi:hypothetical protein